MINIYSQLKNEYFSKYLKWNSLVLVIGSVLWLINTSLIIWFLNFDGFAKISIAINLALLTSVFLSLDSNRRLSRDGQSDIGLPNVLFSALFIFFYTKFIEISLKDSVCVTLIAFCMLIRNWNESWYTFNDNNKMVTFFRALPSLTNTFFVLLLITFSQFEGNPLHALLLAWVVSLTTCVLFGYRGANVMLNLFPRPRLWSDKIIQTIGISSAELVRSGPSIILSLAGLNAHALGRIIFVFQFVERLWQIVKIALYSNAKNHFIAIRRINPRQALEKMQILNRTFFKLNMFIMGILIVVLIFFLFLSSKFNIFSEIPLILTCTSCLVFGYALSSGYSVILEIDFPIASAIITSTSALLFCLSIYLLAVHGWSEFWFGLSHLLRGLTLYGFWLIASRYLIRKRYY